MPDLFDERGQKATLGPRLGRGGEGEVFEILGQPGLVAKVLHPAGRTAAKLDKVLAMVAQPPAGAYEALEGLPVLTWPRHVLHSRPTGQARSTFVGYAMTRVAPHDFVPFYQLTSAARRSALGGQPITWDRLILLGMRLCHVVRTLHRFGYAIGDLNDRNVLVSRRLTPLLMDTDSFQVPKPGWGGHFPSVVGDQQYWPPELLAVDLATYRGDREPGDRHALGVLLFQLFMGGLRPYQARGTLVDGLETLAEKTKAGHYPWASPRKGILEPPTSAPDYRALPKPIRRAFERCFVDGHRHPSKRPTADGWYAALARVKDVGYVPCAAEARHVYGADVRACPWCTDANDPFDPEPKAGRAPKPTVAPVRAATRGGVVRGSGQARRRPASAPQRPLAPTPRPPTAGRQGRGRPRAPAPAMAAAPVRAVKPTLRPARPAAARPTPKSSGKTRARARPGLADRMTARGLWVGGLTLAFASPTAVLASMPLGFEQKVTMAVSTALLVALAGLAGTLPWLHGPRHRIAAAWLWLTAATAATLGLVGTERWSWLVYTTGVACLAIGLAAFARMERGQAEAFRPTPAGLLHGVLGLPLAYLPVLAIWAWSL